MQSWFMTHLTGLPNMWSSPARNSAWTENLPLNNFLYKNFRMFLQNKDGVQVLRSML